jgi:hypothetical protein
MTQFQESATVRTFGDSSRTYSAPFLAITAGLVAVLMAVALISFAVAGRPSDSAVGGNAEMAAGNAYVAGLNAAIHQHQLEQAALAMRRPITAIESDPQAPAGGFAPGYPLQGGLAGPSLIESAQKLRDGWAGALVVRPAADPVDGWEAGLIQESAVDTYSQRFITVD